MTRVCTNLSEQMASVDTRISIRHRSNTLINGITRSALHRIGIAVEVKTPAKNQSHLELNLNLQCESKINPP